MEDSLHKKEGPLLLLAGPGTGKTYRLGKRIQYLVEETDISPENITVITFTSSAARNMKERISDSKKEDLYVTYSKQPRLICTMHSLGYRIVKENSNNLGMKDTVRVVSNDKLRNILLEDAAQLAGFKREDGSETAQCRQTGKGNFRREDKKCKICKQYRKILDSSSAIDYDDQIILACKTLEKNSDLLEKYQSYCKNLLVDEYQDINAWQFKLIKLLTDGQREGLFVVGDDDQSIYSWRGGSPEFIRKFREYFGRNAKIEALTKSFRCIPNVLESAISIVESFDEKRIEKGGFDYEITEGEKIKVHKVPSDIKEAKVIRKITENAIPSQTVLILLPTRNYAEPIVKELRKARINYSSPPTLPGEGLPILSTLLQWLKNNEDSLAFRECLESLMNNKKYGIPSKRSRKTEKLEVRERAFRNVSNLWKGMTNGKTKTLWETFEKSEDKGEYIPEIYASFNDIKTMYDADDSIVEFLHKAVEALDAWKSIKVFSREIDSWVNTTNSDMGSSSNVRIMTLQGAKGLEADVVCIVGIEEDSIPRNLSSSEALEEQSRLMFVSMTRAIKEIHLFYARKRSAAIVQKKIYQKGKPPDITPSRFLKSIPKQYREDIYYKAKK